MLSYSFGPQLERPPSGARSPRACELQNRSFSFGVQNPTLIFFKFSHKLPRASGAWRHPHLVTQYRLGLLWHLSDTSIRSRAPALTPASILHPNNPCAEPKGSQPNQTQRHEPKSLGYFITLRTNYVKAKIDNMLKNSNCRLNGNRYETVDYIISECSRLAQKNTNASTSGWEKWSTRNCARDKNLTMLTNSICRNYYLSSQMRRVKFFWISRYKQIT